MIDLSQNPSVEFRHSTRNAYRIRWKVRNGVSRHQGPSAYPVTYGIQQKAKKYIVNYFIVIFVHELHSDFNSYKIIRV